MIVVGVWAGMPQTTITLLAGLQSVPEELHEAAAIDGAIDAPALPQRHAARPAPDHRGDHDARPDLELQLVRAGLRADRGRTRRQDDAAVAVRLQRGVPYGNWGYAAAMGNVMVIVVGVFLIIYLRGNRKAVQHMIRIAATQQTSTAGPLQYLALGCTSSSSPSRCCSC